MTPSRWWLIGTLPILMACLAAGREDRHLPRETDLRAGALEPSCVVCHPSALDSLRLSRHAGLLENETTKERICQVCHGDADAHVAAARRPESALVPVGPVGAASCRACHADDDWPTSTGAHPWRRREDVTRAELQHRPATTPTVLPHASGFDSFDWDGLLVLGHRFVSRTGSKNRFDTDLQLESGPRLVDGRLTGTGHTTWLDRIDARARDLGDPWRRIDVELAKQDFHSTRFSREDRTFTFRASGDYGRVNRREERTALDFDLDVAPTWSVYASYERAEDDGHWLTRRLAGRNSTPLVPATGVDSPRTLESDSYGVGVRGSVDDLRFRLGLEYLDEGDGARWRYDRPATTNPLLRESEDFASRTTTRGPGVVASLEHDLGPIRIDIDARHRRLDRGLRAEGTTTGADPEEFVTTSSASGDGRAETSWIDGSASVDLSDGVMLTLDLALLWHEETMRLDQFDTTRFPTSGTSVLATDSRDLRTVRRRSSGTLALDAEVADGVIVTVGWGFVDERIELPILDSTGTDPSRGTVRDAGAVIGLRWQPDRTWTLSSRFESFGQSGFRLHEQQEHGARMAEAKLRYRTDHLTGDLFARSRRARNDLTAYGLDSDSVGLSVVWNVDEIVDIVGSYVFARTDVSTLTSFYFDPDPNPVPTVVGFRGDTHTLTTGVELETRGGARWTNDLAWTGTDGSFDVQVLDFRSDLSIALIEGGSLGLRYQLTDYVEAGGLDDYHADLVMIYWSQRFGGHR